MGNWNRRPKSTWLSSYLSTSADSRERNMKEIPRVAGATMLAAADSSPSEGERIF